MIRNCLLFVFCVCVCARAECVADGLLWKTDGVTCIAVAPSGRCPRTSVVASLHSSGENHLAVEALASHALKVATLGGYVSWASSSVFSPDWFDGSRFDFSQFAAPIDHSGCIQIDISGGWSIMQECPPFLICRKSFTVTLETNLPLNSTYASQPETVYETTYFQSQEPTTFSDFVIGWTSVTQVSVDEFSFVPVDIPVQNIRADAEILIGFSATDCQAQPSFASKSTFALQSRNLSVRVPLGVFEQKEVTLWCMCWSFEKYAPDSFSGMWRETNGFMQIARFRIDTASLVLMTLGTVTADQSFEVDILSTVETFEPVFVFVSASVSPRPQINLHSMFYLHEKWAQLFITRGVRCSEREASLQVPFSFESRSAGEMTLDIIINATALLVDEISREPLVTTLCVQYMYAAPNVEKLKTIRVAQKKAILSAFPDDVVWSNKVMQLSSITGVNTSSVIVRFFTSYTYSFTSIPVPTDACGNTADWSEVVNGSLVSLAVNMSTSRWGIFVNASALRESFLPSSARVGRVLICLEDQQSSNMAVQFLGEDNTPRNVLVNIALDADAKSITPTRAKVFVIENRPTVINVAHLLSSVRGIPQSDFEAVRAFAMSDGALVALSAIDDVSSRCSFEIDGVPVRLVNGKIVLQPPALQIGQQSQQYVLCSSLLPGRGEMFVDITVLSAGGFSLAQLELFGTETVVFQMKNESAALLDLPLHAMNLTTVVRWEPRGTSCENDESSQTATLAPRISGNSRLRSVPLVPSMELCIAFLSESDARLSDAHFFKANVAVELKASTTKVEFTRYAYFDSDSTGSITIACPVRNEAFTIRVQVDGTFRGATATSLSAFLNEQSFAIPFNAPRGALYLPFSRDSVLSAICNRQESPLSLSLQLYMQGTKLGPFFNFSLVPRPYMRTDVSPLLNFLVAPLCSARDASCILRPAGGEWQILGALPGIPFFLSATSECVADDSSMLQLSFSGSILPPLAYTLRSLSRNFGTQPIQWLTVCAPAIQGTFKPLQFQWGNGIINNAAVVGIRTELDVTLSLAAIASRRDTACDSQTSYRLYWAESQSAVLFGVSSPSQIDLSAVRMSLSNSKDECTSLNEQTVRVGPQLSVVGDSESTERAAQYGFNVVATLPMEAPVSPSGPLSSADYFFCAALDESPPQPMTKSFLPTFLYSTAPHLEVRRVDIAGLNSFAVLPVQFNSTNNVGPIQLSSCEGPIRTIVMISTDTANMNRRSCANDFREAVGVAEVLDTIPPTFFIPASATTVSAVAATLSPGLLLCLSTSSPSSVTGNDLLRATARVALNPFGVVSEGDIFLTVWFTRVDRTPADSQQVLTQQSSSTVAQQFAAQITSFMNLTCASCVQVRIANESSINILISVASNQTGLTVQLYADLAAQKIILKWSCVEQLNSSLIVPSQVAGFYAVEMSAVDAAPKVTFDPMKVFPEPFPADEKSSGVVFFVIFLVAIGVGLAVWWWRLSMRNKVGRNNEPQSPDKGTEMDVVSHGGVLTPSPLPNPSPTSPARTGPPRTDSMRRLADLEALMQEHEGMRHNIRSLRSANETKENPLYADDVAPTTLHQDSQRPDERQLSLPAPEKEPRRAYDDIE